MDGYAGLRPGAGAPARRLAAVTPNDGADLTAVAKSLYLGGGGDLTLIAAADGVAVTLRAHPAGYVAVQARRVLATGTTAQHIVALFD